LCIYVFRKAFKKTDVIKYDAMSVSESSTELSVRHVDISIREH